MKEHILNLLKETDISKRETRRAFRWIFTVLGVDSLNIKSIQSLEHGKILIRLFWLSDQSWPQEPLYNEGFLRLLGTDGTVAEQFLLKWDRHELLPFDLDYSNGEATLASLVLTGVQIKR